MKRLLALALCAAMCLTGAACAETVGKTGMYNENSILRCVAPNGQELYYLGQWVAERVEPRLEDVNRDERLGAVFRLERRKLRARGVELGLRYRPAERRAPRGRKAAGNL